MSRTDGASGEGIARLGIPIAPMPLRYRTAKRSMDITVAVVGLICTSPIMIAIAAAIRWESEGPALFRQRRIGLGGRPFTMLKFRTMHAGADEDAHRRYVERLLQRAGGDPATWVPLKIDPRVTRVGGFLRRTHLDELPQLMNVLRGDMSVVGPRPPIPYEVELYAPWHLRRLSVIPGLTGLWQVRGWGRLSFDEGVALDLAYVEKRSFMADVRIVVQTIWQIVRRRQF